MKMSDFKLTVTVLWNSKTMLVVASCSYASVYETCMSQSSVEFMQ